MAAGMLPSILAALTSVCDGWNSASVDDFRPPIAFRLGLLRDRAHHVFGEFDGSDLDVADLDAPGLRLRVQTSIDWSPPASDGAAQSTGGLVTTEAGAGFLHGGLR
jgi:hypothetical protein